MKLALRFAASAALSCLSFAQQRLDPSRLYPVTGPVRDAGTVDVTTGKWTRPQAPTKSGSQVIYNNTCAWTGGALLAGFEACEDNYDEGRIPSSNAPNAPQGAQDFNNVVSFQVSYCTYAGPLAGSGGYDMEVAFWNKLNGNCVGSQAPTPPPISATATAYFDLAGLGLPGSTAVGVQACWMVTIDTSNASFVLASDGEGTFDNDTANDSFIWSQSQNQTAAPQGGPADGFLTAGDPAVSPYGACTYTIACGAGQCGTGLDTFDASWINVDGVSVGSSSIPANCPNSIAQYGFGTNCYFFGGYPVAPLASYWLVLESDGRAAVQFCAQSKPTSVPGCTPELSVTDLSLATGAWSVSKVPLGAAVRTTVGVFLYTHGVGLGQSTFSTVTPFGTSCLPSASTLNSSPACAAAVFTGTPSTCVGTFSLPVNCNGGALGIAVGEDVNAQCWYRDPPNPAAANLTNAIFYTVQ
jgi:hypothetical protein